MRSITEPLFLLEVPVSPRLVDGQFLDSFGSMPFHHLLGGSGILVSQN